MDLLCKNEILIGMIGAMFFLGVVISTVVAPPLADAYGRKYVVFFSYIVLIIGLVGLMITTNLYVAYAFEFLVGFSFAGHIIVGLNYLLEFIRKS